MQEATEPVHFLSSHGVAPQTMDSVVRSLVVQRDERVDVSGA